MKNETITLPLRNGAGSITVRLDAIERISSGTWANEARLELKPNGIVWCDLPDSELATIYRKLADLIDLQEQEAKDAEAKIV
jgi:hypothetical protein